MTRQSIVARTREIEDRTTSADPPAERYAEFLVGHDRWQIELRDHGTWGIEALLLKNEAFFISRRFDERLDPFRSPRDMAIAWALEEKSAIEHQ